MSDERKYAKWQDRQSEARERQYNFRLAVFNELMQGLDGWEPESEYRKDHEKIGAALLYCEPWTQIERMPELQTWPETYRWVKSKLENES